jgi:hypothetical protein
LSHLLDSVVHQETEQNLAFIKRASPVALKNINVRGTYKFEKNGKFPKLDDLMATTEDYIPIEKNNLTYRSVLRSAREIFVLLIWPKTDCPKLSPKPFDYGVLGTSQQ